MSRKYKDVAAKMQQDVQRHLKEMKELSSSEDEEPFDTSVLDGILQRYTNGGGDGQMLQRTKHLLEETISGISVTCLICIGSIKRVDAIWTCENCFCFFHLFCIQKWSNDSISLRNNDNHGPIQVVKPVKIEWCCPKCRFSYTKDQVPRKYRCYCSKVDNPQPHPWLLPHSCGEVCGKRLSTGDNCKHKCLLLCHPGPCPPCPQIVNRSCYCEGEQKKVRCSSSQWSCGNPCKKLLSCYSHYCEHICHDGPCSSCLYTSVQACLCGSEQVKRPCNDPFWQCKKICNKPFSCGYHKCKEICHSVECGTCPNSGNKTCPCGANQRYVECPDSMETCLGTCNKQHSTCEHSCPEKCHKGECPPCQVVVEKKCYCNTHVKSLPCSKEFKCEAKCRGTRPCGKHNCGRKCCNGNCPPCEKICDKPLQCGRHKCSNVCHNGPCYPCHRESKITCRCKETFITVPCGREKLLKPPKCTKLCKIKYKCGHMEKNAHKCHFGDCPACKAICNKVYPCGHACHAKCHEYVAVTFKQVNKPATPWEVKPPKTEILTLECAPCDTPVTFSCYGNHESTSQPCHSAAQYSCGRNCNQPLPCGNHNCKMPCHFLSPNKDHPNVPKACEPCVKECAVPRPEKCIHKCAKQVCHSDDCPPCKTTRRINCHCGLNEIYIDCCDLQTATEEALSCKQQCPKNMECGHRCKTSCHSGPCSLDQKCTKKTKVHCSCGNLKKEMQCSTARSGAKVLCDNTCDEKIKQAELEKQLEQKRLKDIEEEKNKRELAEFEWKMSGKKRKHKEKRVVCEKDDRSFVAKYWIPILSFLVLLLAVVYMFIYTDLLL